MGKLSSFEGQRIRRAKKLSQNNLYILTVDGYGPLSGKGPIWESQYYDHAIRTDDELRERVSYCLQNPVRKGDGQAFQRISQRGVVG
jgi:hypothetical protein